MAQPDVGDVHVNALLTNLSIGYQPAGFFAERMFPVANVLKQTDIYPVYDKSHWARNLGAPGAAPSGSYGMMRAPGTQAVIAGFTVDNTNAYRCVNWALGAEIPDELRENADMPFDLDRDYTLLVNTLLRLHFDRLFAAAFMTTSVWTTDYAGGSDFTKWSDYGGSTPIEDIRKARRVLRQQTLGMAGNIGKFKLLLGALAKDELLDHPDLLERLIYGASQGNPARITLDMLAALFEVDEVVVAESVYTADEEEGTAEADVTYADVITDDALLLWVPEGPQRNMPSAGYMFNWRPLTGGGLLFMRKGRENRPRRDWLEAHSYLHWCKTNAGAGVFFDDAVD